MTRTHFIACAFLGVVFLSGGCGGDEPGKERTVRRDVADAPAHKDEIRGELSTATNKDFDPATKKRGGRVVLPLVSDVDNFNPYLSTSADAGRVHDMIYLRLLEEHADYHQGPPTFTPLLAVSRPKKDGKNLIYKLRDDAFWSDGTPVTSTDIRFSWLAAKNPDVAWASASIVRHIVDIEIHDDKNFTIHFDADYPDMEMDSKDTHIIPEHVFGKIAFKEWKSYAHWDEAASVVNGYYRVKDYKHNEEFLLVPNERFWDKGIPLLDEVYFRVIKDRQTVFESMLTGEIDCQPTVQPVNAKKVLDHPDLYLYTFLSRYYYYIGWNCKHPIFKDKVVRNAMTLAIDRRQIVKSVFLGYAKLMASPIISSMWACDRSLEPLPYSPEKAIELLESAGWKLGADGIREKDGKKFSFTLSTNAGNEDRAEIQQMVQSQLKSIGLDVKIGLQEFNAFGENLRKGREEAWIGAWNVATKVDPKPTWHTSGIGGFNFCQYSNKKVDDLIERGAIEPDRKKAMQIWKEFQAIMYDEQGYTLIGELHAMHALHKRFQNVEMNSLSPYFNIWEWFIPKSKRLVAGK
ncbi:MAG: ABC transporter substrate-binding protein [Planctomycetota bacterium]